MEDGESESYECEHYVERTRSPPCELESDDCSDAAMPQADDQPKPKKNTVWGRCPKCSLDDNIRSEKSQLITTDISLIYHTLIMRSLQSKP